MTEYMMIVRAKERWFYDDIVMSQLNLDPETNQWSGSCLRVINAGSIPGETTSCGTAWRFFGEYDKAVYIARDYAGNTLPISCAAATI